jgi:hypothetical protein
LGGWLHAFERVARAGRVVRQRHDPGRRTGRPDCLRLRRGVICGDRGFRHLFKRVIEVVRDFDQAAACVHGGNRGSARRTARAWPCLVWTAMARSGGNIRGVSGLADGSIDADMAARELKLRLQA